MSWKLVSPLDVETDIADAAAWYESHERRLGAQFVSEVRNVWRSLADNPFLNSRKHPSKPIHWRRTERFPYRVVYEVFEAEKTVLIIAVLHSARHDRQWRKRIR